MSGEKKRGQGSRRERVGVYIDTERTNRFALKKKKKNRSDSVRGGDASSKTSFQQIERAGIVRKWYKQCEDACASAG